ncbi:MAG: S8 family serine peptidase [Planctomycetota bacterium]
MRPHRNVRTAITTTAASAALLAAGQSFGQAVNPADLPGMVRVDAPELLSIRPDRLVHISGSVMDTRNAKPIASLARDIRQGVATRRQIVQFDGPMTPQRRAQLADAGLRVLDYLPTNAFIVDTRNAEADAVEDLGFVRWHDGFRNAWKLSPEIGLRPFVTAERQGLADIGRLPLIATLFADEQAGDAVQAIFDTIPTAQVHYAEQVGPQVEISVSIEMADLADLAGIDAVQFIEDAPEITFRNVTSNWIAQSNQSNVTPLHDNGIRGAGQIVGVMDGRIDVNHCSFSDTNPIGPTHRKILAYNTGQGTDFHGTHVAGTVVGDAGAANDTRGIAYEGKLVFHVPPSFTDSAMYSRLQTHHNQGARVHTNSWGDDGTTLYNGLCRGVDRFSYDFEDSLVLFAVTNTSTLRNPDNAKNLLAVGATQDFPNQGSHCSGGVGPTVDGRRKPEIYLPGCGTRSSSAGSSCGTAGATGTSMACPAVAASAMLVRQYYQDGFYPNGAANPIDAINPTGALVKATLLNSATDMTGVGGYPSNLEGWGRAVLDDTLHFVGDSSTLYVEDVRNADGLSTGEQTGTEVNVTGAGAPLRITLVWTEPPASASTGTAQASVNDLDLRVVSPGGTTYLGNAFSGGVSQPGGSKDAINNVEQVLIPSPSAGTWAIEVVGAAVNVDTQGYALVVSGEVVIGPSSLRLAGPTVLGPLIAPGEAPQVQIDVVPGDDTFVPGSAKLFFAADGTNFVEQTLVSLGGDTWGATLPAVGCDDTPAYYFEAAGQATGTVLSPPSGAASPYAFDIGELVITLSDDSETDTGWTATDSGVTAGQWERGIPVNGVRGDPAADFDGSGQAWVTQNDLGPLNDGNSDVDDGSVTLTSPAMEVAAGDTVSWAYWLNDIPNGELGNEDGMTVEVATDAAGTNWTQIRAYDTPQGSWRSDAYQAAVATSTFRIRFTASDNSPGDVVEAAIDALEISRTECVAAPPACPGDVDGDNDTDLADFTDLASNFGATGLPFGSGQSRSLGDLDDDGDVDLQDFTLLSQDFGCTP